MNEALAEAARAIRAADSVVALTGAGVSTASGIPDFRSEGGLWEKHDPQNFHYSRFRADPEGFWRDRLAMFEDIYAGGDIAPNPAHEAFADLESAGHLSALITQNIDGLHRAAGSGDVVELHGTGAEVVCMDCGERDGADPAWETVKAGNAPPRCDSCEGVLKPAVVLFGQSMPQAELHRAQSLASNSDVFIVAGSSLSVEPAASLPRTAARNGATTICVNLEETGFDADYTFTADVTDVLPRLVTAVRKP
ncbi:Sir2 family NAD-dependent protein deacetylase [Haladaptatus sp. DYSN1]|uniref:SIR2 family NAD-dependent protein deacylase n=1 Tax=unclassified Haladaptatus TaxID=2622732 RepID=UPI0024066635|nr:Sir2 family NAD-dependent protein deacetylase [Haladaptatus sp. DYSN1]